MCFMEPQKEGRCISQNWTLYFAKLNFRNRFSKGRKELLPPWVKWGNKDGQELIETGDQILAYFITACGLQPNAHVLDIGCGIGRMAVALTHYLTNEGGYDGIDIIPGVIKWCTRKITRQYPRFCFHFADIYNKDYNPRGRVKASDYAFPFGKDSFDFVILVSVFTHMLPEDLEHYISEIAQVLKPGGTCFATYFLLNPETLEHIESGKSTLDLRFMGNRYRTVSREVSEHAVAYDEDYVINLYAQNGFTIAAPIRYVTWSVRATDYEYQDFVVAQKVYPLEPMSTVIR